VGSHEAFVFGIGPGAYQDERQAGTLHGCAELEQILAIVPAGRAEHEVADSVTTPEGDRVALAETFGIDAVGHDAAGRDAFA
jgi:hypothetical protein